MIAEAGQTYSAGRVAEAGSYAGPFAPPTIEAPELPGPDARPGWLDATRDLLRGGGDYVVFEDGGVRVVRLADGWSRVGRSATSDIRLDDPTVSRRHALIARSGGQVRVLDDRSLNGVRLNGDQVEWGTLADGDELAIGRFRLYLVALEPAGSAAGSGTSAPPSA